MIEATLRNALADCNYFTDEQLQGAGALKPTYKAGVALTIVGDEGTALTGVKEITAAEAQGHGFTPIENPENPPEVSRWFLVPYDKANFPTGEVTHLTVKAIPPAEQTATPEN